MTPTRLVLDVEKAKDWIAKGAQPTDRVARLLDGAGVMKREARNNPEKAKPKKKAQERAAAAAAKAAAARPLPRRKVTAEYSSTPAAPRPLPAGISRAERFEPRDAPRSRRRLRRAAWRAGRDAAEVLHGRSDGHRRLSAR